MLTNTGDEFTGRQPGSYKRQPNWNHKFDLRWQAYSLKHRLTQTTINEFKGASGIKQPERWRAKNQLFELCSRSAEDTTMLNGSI
ncbi:hypothetical protein LBMAG37_16180 [Anaerolineae bacterium]|nr:hypothetical protein LBMAG37_16180 [Anaerolineae bacterium]